MLGGFRALLAAIVVAFHLGVQPCGVWMGVSAVAMFYMISGYAMTGLLESRFSSPRCAPRFYAERFVRLAPQYYLWMTLLALQQFAFVPTTLDMSNWMPYGLTAYLTVLPMGLQAYLGTVKTWLNPVVTTLGIECCLYVFSPWVLRSHALSIAAAIAGLGIFVAADAGVMDFNTYTYYTFPGPLIFYMLGSFVYRKRWAAFGVFATALVVLLLRRWPTHFHQEYLAVMLLGVPVFLLLVRLPANRIDSALGDASYGCYLGHGMVMGLFQHLLGRPASGLEIVAVSALALVYGYLAFWLVERPTIPFRRRIRGPAPA
ncbi:MAG: acyltransferase [Planctomycetia bacterium]|nr:acyltransferase [Planctomycetia bacterium]